MNRRDRLDTVVQKRLKALVEDLPSARHGSVEALHRTRVASRRVREALPLLSESLGEKLTKTRKRTKRITRALGKVREFDVSIALLDTIPPLTPRQRVALERVRVHLTRQRGDLRKVMRERLHELRPSKVVRKIAGKIEGRAATEGRPSEAWRATLQGRLERRSANLVDAIVHAGELYVPDRLHAVRISAKKLRYALELAGETGRGGTAHAVRALKYVQDTLGRLNDYQVLADHVRHVQATLSPAAQDQIQALDLVLSSIDSECRRLHARYIARRHAIKELCATVRESPPRLWVRKPTTSSASTAADRPRNRP
jgi:CHAD domain-containing protein